MKQKVVIIGHGFTSRLGVIRSIAQLGCEITVIVMTGYKRDGQTLNTKKPIDSYSKYVDKVYYCYTHDEQGLIQLLLDKCTDPQQKVVIIPDSDFSATAIDKHQDVLKDSFSFPHIRHTQGAIVEWMNKEKQKALAVEVGLDVVNSVILNVAGGNYKIPNDIHYPCFTKARSYIKNCKQTLKKCNSKEELHDLVDSIAAKQQDFTLLVEDFKRIDSEYAICGFSDGKNVVIPGVIQIVELAHGGHFGVACTGKIMPVNGFEAFIEKFRKFILSIGFVGVFDIDFYQSDGIFYFSELNLRIGGSCYAVTKMGVNLPAMLVKTLTGEKIEDMQEQITDTATYVNERMLLDDWSMGYRSFREYKELEKKADISFVKDKEDKAPYRAYQWEFIKRRVKRQIRLGLSFLGK